MENWKGFQKINFKFEGMEAILVLPEQHNRTNNWLMKMEYWEAFQDLEYEMVKQGWHLAYIMNESRWCKDEDIDRKKRFADYLRKEYGLSDSFVPVGMSCGGIFAVKFAAKYPSYVSALYLDAPVMNFLSCPADLGLGRSNQAEPGIWDGFEKSTGMNVSQLLGYREHPLDKLSLLVQHKIPTVLIYGDADSVVPYCENGEFLEKIYREQGLELLCIGKAGCEHHPHGLKDPKPIVNFLKNH